MSRAAEKEKAKAPMATGDDDVQVSSKSAQKATGSSTDTAEAAAEECSSEQQATAGPSDRSASPEPNCAICLGQLENKSFTDSCFHMFCFVCLQEWSKVKAECPLCKQPFKSIIHNVKSYNNYDQFYLDHRSSRPPPDRMNIFGWNYDRSFHYRTTVTFDHRYFNNRHHHHHHHHQHHQQQQLQQQRLAALASTPYERPRPRLRPRTRSTQPDVAALNSPMTDVIFRRHIYNTGRRVSGLRATSRRRKVTPQFYRDNPAQIHRLVPWLRRELNVLLYNTEETVNFVQDLILDLIKRFQIHSEEFYELLHPYLQGYTRHFMHEFLSFARSPYAMNTYDEKAVYDNQPQPGQPQQQSSTDSITSDSDVVVVDDDDDNDNNNNSDNNNGAINAWRQHQQPNLALASSMSGWRSPQVTATATTQSSMLARSRWDSPTPGPSWDLGGGGNSSHSPVNVEDSSESNASTIIDPTYVAEDQQQVTGPSPGPQQNTPDGDDDDEAVIFMSYDKPWEERSPIQLSSGSESEHESGYSLMIKALKQEHSRRKKAKSSSSSSAPHQNATECAQSQNGEGSSSLTPALPSTLAGEQSRSHKSRPSSLDGAASSTSSRRGKDHSRHHKKKRHRDRSDQSPQQPSSKKRKSSHNSTGAGGKKKRHRSSNNDNEEQEEEEETTTAKDTAESSSSHKKQKHKKRKKSKGRREKQTSGKHTAADSPPQTETSQHGSQSEEAESSSTARNKGKGKDRCKKHPSGHKSSRVKRTEREEEGDEEEGLRGEGGSEHVSDGPLSDWSSTSSVSSCSTTTPGMPTLTPAIAALSATSPTPTLSSSLPPVLSSPPTFLSRQQRLRQVLEERRRQVPSWLSPLTAGGVGRGGGLVQGMAPSWDISLLTRMLMGQSSSTTTSASGSFTPLLPTGPSQSAADPVVITSDDSDAENSSVAFRINSDAVPVAQTVVVPCSANPELPTAAIPLPTFPPFPTLLPSTSEERPIVLDGDPVDVETISSEDEGYEREVVDVESVTSMESDTDTADATAAHVRALTLRFKFAETETERVLSPPTVAAACLRRHCTAELSSDDDGPQINKSSSALHHAAAAGKKAKGKCGISSSSRSAFKSSSSLRRKKSIVKQDVFMGSEVLSQPSQPSTTTSHSSQDLAPTATITTTTTNTTTNTNNPSQPLSHDYLSQQQGRMEFTSSLDQLCWDQDQTTREASSPGANTASGQAAAPPLTQQPSAQGPSSSSSDPPTSQQSSDIPVGQASEDSKGDPPVSPAAEEKSQSQSDSPSCSQHSSLSPDHGKQAQCDNDEKGGDTCKWDIGDGSGDWNKMSFSTDEKGFELTADSQLFAEEESTEGKEKKEEETGELVQEGGVDFPFDKLHKNEASNDGSVTGKQNTVELPEDKKCEDQDDMLGDPLTSEIDEDAEKLLLSDDSCVPSDQARKDFPPRAGPPDPSEPASGRRPVSDCDTTHTLTTGAASADDCEHSVQHFTPPHDDKAKSTAVESDSSNLAMSKLNNSDEDLQYPSGTLCSSTQSHLPSSTDSGSSMKGPCQISQEDPQNPSVRENSSDVLETESDKDQTMSNQSMEQPAELSTL